LHHVKTADASTRLYILLFMSFCELFQKFTAGKCSTMVVGKSVKHNTPWRKNYKKKYAFYPLCFTFYVF